jgi:enoyl-CoA hydratase/carnithine racemase
MAGMADYELLNLDRRDNGVAVITLANGKMNALSLELVGELHSAADELTADPPGAVVVTGGDRLLAAGADISQFGGPDEAAVIGVKIHGALDAIAAIPRFVIAAVSGYALGGGCELALACDYRIASTRAVFGQPEVSLGIVPGGGGTQRLPRTIGPGRAKEMCISGRQVKAEEALRIGLADEVVDPDELHHRALALAADVAKGALVAQSICKRLIDDGMSTSLEEGLALERDGFVEVFGTDDARIGVASFQKNGPGKAEFTGR